ncbi:YkvA family protein [Kangiella sp. TOML190]|uniref:YkvA family protein n=1 Tax=Kangiella sp. TOML190 TaxID=2931351 RepID=UPI00203B2D80|nr:YkvA family protein [Kangiella sp. TOML190]
MSSEPPVLTKTKDDKAKELDAFEISNQDYKKHYSDESFWQKTKQFAIKIGKEAMEKSLIMYYCMKDPDTPAKHKSIILSALGYFILPVDLIPDILPGGWMDDLGALALAFSTVTSSIKEEHLTLAQQKLDKFFKKNHDQVTETKK